MKTVKHSVFAIGVVLSTAPIFNSAFAQSPTDSATVLLELQTLRSEIAELRDMVERQQFELKKLKQSSAKHSTAQTQQGLVRQGTYQGTYPSATVPVEGSYNPDLGQNPHLNQGEQVQGGTLQQPNSVNTQNQDTALSDDVSVANQGVEITQAGTVLSNGVEVVDRRVAVPSADTHLETGAVPVVERSIGGYQTPSTRENVIGGNTVDRNSQPIQTPASETNRPNIASNRPVLAVPSNAQGNGWGVINANQVPTSSTQEDTQTTAANVVGGSETVGSQTGAKPLEPTAFTQDQFYDRGFDLLKQSKYDEAINVFEQQISYYPQGELADDAHYWIAEAMFINRKPTEAKPHLRAIIDNYPQSARLPDAMLKTAYIEQDLGNLIEARILLQEIVANHPSSNAAIAAKNRLGNLKSGN